MRVSASGLGFAAALSAGLLLAWWAYAPGLLGTYTFDDVQNLAILGAHGPIRDLDTLLLYLTSGRADPTGRPLALLAFLIDARSWPAPPLPFKITNLLLHLLNGVLLALAMRAVARRTTGLGSRADAVAACAAALWLLHPLLVSTTLYIVQREAMLPATFFLIALLGWLHARDMVAQGRSARGWVLAAMSVLGGTLLAALCKPNGLLIPLLLLVCDRVLVPQRPTGAEGPAALAQGRRMRIVFLLLPTLALAALVALQLPDAIQSAALYREWSLGERLLTQPRVLFQYARLLLVPEIYSDGLFNDQLAASRGLLSPATTLFSLLGVAAAIAAAIVFRKRFAALAGAVLFFFAAHSLEAGPISLELFFEHRNYLPSLLLGWPLAVWLLRPRPGQARALLLAKLVCALLLPLGLAAMTRAAASVWSEPVAQARIWADLNPQSPRAQAFAAQWELALDDIAGAERRLESAIAANPDNLHLALNIVGTSCHGRGVQPRDFDRAVRLVATRSDHGELAVKWLQQAVADVAAGTCRGLTEAHVARMLAAFEGNPRTRLDPRRRGAAAHVRGVLHLRHGERQEAARAFERVAAIDPEPLTLLVQASLLYGAGARAAGERQLQLLATLPRKPWYRWRSMTDVHEALLQRRGYWAGESERLRRAFARQHAPASTI